MWDPGLTGSIRHEVYLKSMKGVKRKNEKEIQYERVEKGVQELCVMFRERKINPITIFEEADVDGRDGVSVVELEDGFTKLFPDETTFTIKKWVSLINQNQDN